MEFKKLNNHPTTISPGIYSSFREHFERLDRGLVEGSKGLPSTNPQPTPYEV